MVADKNDKSGVPDMSDTSTPTTTVATIFKIVKKSGGIGVAVTIFL